MSNEVEPRTASGSYDRRLSRLPGPGLIVITECHDKLATNSRILFEALFFEPSEL